MNVQSKTRTGPHYFANYVQITRHWHCGFYVHKFWKQRGVQQDFFAKTQVDKIIEIAHMKS